jgi:hypothetical protein
VSAGTWLQARADGSLQQLSADNYYGQRDARGLPHGRGIRLTPQGAVICRQCGQWADGVLLKERSVARSLLPAYTPLAERVLSADLLLSDGSFYVGSLNAHNLPHGQRNQKQIERTQMPGQRSCLFCLLCRSPAHSHAI